MFIGSSINLIHVRKNVNRIFNEQDSGKENENKNEEDIHIQFQSRSMHKTDS